MRFIKLNFYNARDPLCFPTRACALFWFRRCRSLHKARSGNSADALEKLAGASTLFRHCVLPCFFVFFFLLFFAGGLPRSVLRSANGWHEHYFRSLYRSQETGTSAKFVELRGEPRSGYSKEHALALNRDTCSSKNKNVFEERQN